MYGLLPNFQLIRKDLPTPEAQKYESANASLIDCAKDISLAIWFAPAVPADVFGFRTHTRVAQTYVSIVRDFQALFGLT